LILIGQIQEFALAHVRFLGQNDTQYIKDKLLEGEDVTACIKDFKSTTVRFLVITDGTYRVLATKGIDRKIGSTYFNAQLLKASQNGWFQNIVKTGDHRSISYASKIVVSNRTYLLDFSYQTADDSIRFTTIGLELLSMVLILCFIAYLVSRIHLHYYRRPLKKLLKNAKNTALPQSDFQVLAVDNEAADEIKELVASFNQLVYNHRVLLEADRTKISRMNSLLSDLSSGILMTDRNGKVTLINPKACSFLDVQERELFCQPLTMDSNQLFAQILHMAQSVFTDEKNRNQTMRKDDGTIIEAEARILFDKYIPYAKEGVLVMLRDITEHWQLEQMKDEFVANVSHELKTPMAILSGYAQALADKQIELSKADKEECISAILSETGHMEHLIEELLSLSRIDQKAEEPLEQIHLQPLLEAACTLQSEKVADRGIHIQCSLSSNPALIKGKQLWVMQVIGNLLDNAMKYSGNGTQITVEEYESGENVIIRITDQGIGISKADIPHIFERFYRVEKSRNSEIAGSGLGLSIVRKLMEKMQGTIEVQSTVGKGTTFCLTWEKATDTAARKG
jgi:two-component system phosphate regulon sensor histidine kinase PhoR